MKNLVILISGRGSNMVAIAQACACERWDARLAQSFLGRYTQMMALRSFEDAKDLVDELRPRHER